MIIPYNKIYFIIYDPGACGTFIQNILYLSSKYSNQENDFEYKDGTAHAVKNDCFNKFHGVDINKNITDEILPWFNQEISALKDRDSLISFLEERWNNKNHEYYSHRIATLTYHKLIDLLPESKFIYCKLDFITTLKNLDTKIISDGVKGIPVDSAWSNKKNIHNTLGALLYFHDTKKLMDEFIYSQKRENVLILDIEKLIFDDNSIEIDKLIEFTCITDVKKETIVKLIHLYRDAQFNLNYHPIWDKFLIAYEKLNK